jgi:crotonobetainyl-CoA:carnitine CoA-transferase CaiB-like acyl-CoA transferase
LLSQALDGVRIVELCNYVAGPLVGLVLADMGAEVIKLERLDGGDDGRLLPPFLDGDGYFFTECNRNKRSVALDVTSESGRDLAVQLIARADVVLDNFRFGVMERLGLSYEVLREANPRLIACSVTGFGNDNAYANRPGYDPILQAMSGLMLVTGFDGEPPVRVGPSIVDKTAAIWAACGVVSALFERERTGKGQQLNVSLLGAAVHIMTQDILRYMATGKEPKRQGGAGSGGGPHGSFLAQDGTWVQIAVGNDRIFRRFCEAAEREELATDPRFAKMAGRIENAAELGPIVDDIFASRPAQDWLIRLSERGVPCGPVNTVGGFIADPVIQEHYLFQSRRSSGNQVPQVRTPLTAGGLAEIRLPPPQLGEHTEEVLAKELGLGPGELAALREASVIG